MKGPYKTHIGCHNNRSYKKGSNRGAMVLATQNFISILAAQSKGTTNTPSYLVDAAKLAAFHYEIKPFLKRQTDTLLCASLF